MTEPTPEGIEPAKLFSNEPVDETGCEPGEVDCGVPLQELEPDHPSLP